MRATEIKDLVIGLLKVALIALAIGKLDALHSLAAKQAAHSLRGWDSHPFFTARAFQNRSQRHGSHSCAEVHFFALSAGPKRPKI